MYNNPATQVWDSLESPCSSSDEIAWLQTSQGSTSTDLLQYSNVFGDFSLCSASVGVGIGDGFLFPQTSFKSSKSLLFFIFPQPVETNFIFFGARPNSQPDVELEVFLDSGSRILFVWFWCWDWFGEEMLASQFYDEKRRVIWMRIGWDMRSQMEGVFCLFVSRFLSRGMMGSLVGLCVNALPFYFCEFTALG